MVKRATVSARKHGILLRHGQPNQGTGDCAFEAVIYNNNERACYRDKYNMSVDWYRRIWMIDMANRSRADYNIYSDQEWQEGWAGHRCWFLEFTNVEYLEISCFQE